MPRYFIKIGVVYLSSKSILCFSTYVDSSSFIFPSLSFSIKNEKPEWTCKFDYVWEKLKLAPGMTLIDFGCGYVFYILKFYLWATSNFGSSLCSSCGDWLDYVKSRGVEAVGINITEGQVEVCKRRGKFFA